MKKIKSLTPIIVALVFFLCFVFVFPVHRSNVANGITGTKIKEIRMSMPLDEVISILGKPYEIENLAGQHDFSCRNPKFLEMRVNNNTDIIQIVDSFFNVTPCCDAYKESIQNFERVTLTYSKRPCFLKSLFTSYPMLWIHLDSNYQVWNVFAKYYSDDDICIYSLSWKTDTTTWEEIPGEISLSINDELFNKCFKK